MVEQKNVTWVWVCWLHCPRPSLRLQSLKNSAVLRMTKYSTFWSSNYQHFCTGFFSTVVVVVVVVEKVASQLSLWTKEETRVGLNDAEKIKNEHCLPSLFFGSRFCFKTSNHNGMLQHSLGRVGDIFCSIFLLLPWNKCPACMPMAVGCGIAMRAFIPRREQCECWFNKTDLL